MSNQKLEKHEEYTVKIIGALSVLFNKDEEDENENYIGLEDIIEGDNSEAFLHALANIAPFHVYHKLTGDQKDDDILEFNYIANRLIFQFAKPETEK